MADSAPIMGAPTRAPAILRRSLLAAAAFAPIMATVPVLGTTPSPFRVAEARYRAATDRFNRLPFDLETTDPAEYHREEQAYLTALRAVDGSPAADWSEFADAFHIACDGGAEPSERRLDIQIARRRAAACGEGLTMGAPFRILPHHRRVAIETEIELHLQRVSLLIARLDRADSDPDLEDDDPAGDPLDEHGEAPTDDGQPLLRMMPLWAVNQATGPLNERVALRDHLAS